jgi:hypothetical protein
MVPFVPTATNCVPDQAMPCRGCETPALRDVHVIPSGEVKMPAVGAAPGLATEPPTATNCELDEATPTGKAFAPMVCTVSGNPVTVIGT